MKAFTLACLLVVALAAFACIEARPMGGGGGGSRFGGSSMGGRGGGRGGSSFNRYGGRGGYGGSSFGGRGGSPYGRGKREAEHAEEQQQQPAEEKPVAEEPAKLATETTEEKPVAGAKPTAVPIRRRIPNFPRGLRPGAKGASTGPLKPVAIKPTQKQAAEDAESTPTKSNSTAKPKHWGWGGYGGGWGGYGGGWGGPHHHHHDHWDEVYTTVWEEPPVVFTEVIEEVPIVMPPVVTYVDVEPFYPAWPGYQYDQAFLGGVVRDQLGYGWGDGWGWGGYGGWDGGFGGGWGGYGGGWGGFDGGYGGWGGFGGGWGGWGW